MLLKLYFVVSCLACSLRFVMTFLKNAPGLVENTGAKFLVSTAVHEILSLHIFAININC